MKNKMLSDYDISLQGQLTVNLPVLILLFLTVIFFIALDFSFNTSLLFGMIISWIYWSFAIIKWIQWAKKHEIEEERLIKIGVRKLLIWSGRIVKKEFQTTL